MGQPPTNLGRDDPIAKDSPFSSYPVCTVIVAKVGFTMSKCRKCSHHDRWSSTGQRCTRFEHTSKVTKSASWKWQFDYRWNTSRGTSVSQSCTRNRRASRKKSSICTSLIQREETSILPRPSAFRTQRCPPFLHLPRSIHFKEVRSLYRTCQGVA